MRRRARSTRSPSDSAPDFADNELEEARLVARRLGCRHHGVEVSSEDFAEFLPTAVRALEEPIATASTQPFYRVCQLARESVKVVLTGQGADEPFAGYDRVTAARFQQSTALCRESLRSGLVRPMVHRCAATNGYGVRSMPWTSTTLPTGLRRCIQWSALKNGDSSTASSSRGRAGRTLAIRNGDAAPRPLRIALVRADRRDRRRVPGRVGGAGLSPATCIPPPTTRPARWRCSS